MIYEASHISHPINGLGVTASHMRKIRSGSEYDHLFPRPDRRDPLISARASVFNTLDFMADIIQKTTTDTAKIAPKLSAGSVVDTCRNIWEFCYNHIQYKQDSPGEEQLRRPARSWADRKSGIDCDCFSIFVSSILVNLAIPHKLRICEINRKGYYQHVYVIVPNGAGYITIDPVLDTFNQEAPGISKTFDKMIPVRYLNGLDEDSLLLGTEFDGLTGCACQNGAAVSQQFNERLATHLRNTRNAINASACSLGGIYDRDQLIGALDYAIAAADDSDAFLGALSQLVGIDDDMGVLAGYEDLGKAKKPGVFTKAAAAVKTVKEAAQKATNKIDVDRLKEKAKEAGKAVVRVNPLTTAARAGLLLAMEINMFGMANQLRWAYATPEQLKKYGVSPAEQAKAKSVLAKVEKLFADKLQGKAENLKKAILSGKQALNGLSGLLGEPVTAATGTAAASAFIAQIVKWIKDAGLNIKEKNPELVKEVSAGAREKVRDVIKNAFTKREASTVKNGQVVTTEKPTPPDATFPQAKEITESMAPEAPASPAQPAAFEAKPLPQEPPQAETPQDAPPPPAEKKSNTGLFLILGATLLIGAALMSGGNSGGSAKPALNGPGKSKSKASGKRKSKTPGKRKTRKSYKIS